MAFAEASPDTVAKLKKGKEANFIIYEAPGIGMPMKLSLDGFSTSLASSTTAGSARCSSASRSASAIWTGVAVQ